MTTIYTTALNVTKHGTHAAHPQFGIYADGERNDLAIVKGDNAEAYANLFAAAPEILEALRGTVQQLEDYRKTGYMSGWDKSLTQARAAIARTKGQ